MAQGTTKGVPIDIDPLLAADSDLLVPSQKAIKTYVDTGLLTKQGALTLTTTGTSGASTLLGNTLNVPQYQAVLTNPVTGTGTNNEIAYFNSTGSTIASLPTATYPSLTELSYVKGVTSAIQTQLNTKTTDWYVTLGQQAMGSTVKSVCLIAPSMQMVGTVISFTSQQCRFVAVYLPQAATITGVKWIQQANGNYTASNYNGVGLYTYSGGTLTRVALSTNDNACWSQGGSVMNSKAFSSTYSASAGLYFIGAMYSASAAATVPTILGTSTLANSSMSMDLTNSAKLSGQVSTLTALPSTQAMSGISLNGNGFTFWLY